MNDRDPNGVDILDRFLAYKSRFVEFGMTQHLYFDVVRYIETLRAERDEARREVCMHKAALFREAGVPRSSYDVASEQGWDCFCRLEQDDALNRMAALDEEMGLI